MQNSNDSACVPKLRWWLVLCVLGLTNTSVVAQNEQVTAGSRWQPFTQGGYVHQFDTDIDNGGEFDIDRLFVQGGMAYLIGPGRRFSLSLGLGRDRYDFSGDSGFASLRPWDSINQFRISTPVNWAVDEKWSVFLVPTLRSSAESGADFDDSITGGALAGFAYRFSDTLTLGPGIGVLSQLEDSTSVFPILIIDWQITDRLSLSTSRGLAATEGPGLSLSYQLSESWDLGLGARFESQRFRLDDDGSAPDGIGEDSSLPVFMNATYSPSKDIRLGILVGAELDGELRQEDSKGNKIAEEDYDPAPFLGFTFDLRF